MARGKGIILTQSKWVFWPSVSLLALAFIDLHNICLKFLAPWVLPDPNEKPNSFPVEGATGLSWTLFWAFLFYLLQPLWASSIFLFLPQDRQGLSFLSPLPISAYLLSTWLHLKMSCFNSPLTSVVSRDHACPSPWRRLQLSLSRGAHSEPCGSGVKPSLWSLTTCSEISVKSGMQGQEEVNCQKYSRSEPSTAFYLLCHLKQSTRPFPASFLLLGKNGDPKTSTCALRVWCIKQMMQTGQENCLANHKSTKQIEGLCNEGAPWPHEMSKLATMRVPE